MYLVDMLLLLFLLLFQLGMSVRHHLPCHKYNVDEDDEDDEDGDVLEPSDRRGTILNVVFGLLLAHTVKSITARYKQDASCRNVKETTALAMIYLVDWYPQLPTVQSARKALVLQPNFLNSL